MWWSGIAVGFGHVEAIMKEKLCGRGIKTGNSW